MNCVTSRLKKLKNNSISLPQHCEDGLNKEKFNALDLTHQKQMEENEYTTLMILNEFLDYQTKLLSSKKNEFAMQELVQIIKKGTLNDKLSYWKKNIQIQLSSKTSEVDLTGKDKVLKPFWNRFIQTMSQKLWLPIETDFVDSDMNSLNGSLKNTMLRSWFSSRIQTTKLTPLMNSQKTYWQSLQFLLQEIMDSEQQSIKNQKIIKQDKKTTNKNLSLSNKILKYVDYIDVENVNKSIELHNDLRNYLKIKKEKDLNKKRDIKKEKNINYLDPRDKEEAGKSRRIRIYPTKTQKETLNKWFGCSRYIYNQCVKLVSEEICDDKIDSLRNKIINEETNIYKHQKWLSDYHYDLKDEAIRNYLFNVKSNMAKGNKFKISFKQKGNESISILAKHWNKNNFFKDILTSSKLKTSEVLPRILYTCRLIKTKTNKYFLNIPEPLKNQEQGHMNKSIFIDPGEYQILTGFDPDGYVITFGKQDIGHIARLQYYYRKLQSKITKVKDSKKRKRMKIALLRINERIYNLVDDMHKKITNFLVKSYNNIHIPKLNFHNFKKMTKKHKTMFASLRHCSLIDRIINKTREYPKTKVFIETEEYTSKTCTGCGHIDINLGNKKEYKCSICDLNISRDTNGARNIMLKCLYKYFKRAFVTDM